MGRDMILKAIGELDEKTGSSVSAIKKYISENWPEKAESSRFPDLFKKAIVALLEEQEVIPRRSRRTCLMEPQGLSRLIKRRRKRRRPRRRRRPRLLKRKLPERKTLPRRIPGRRLRNPKLKLLAKTTRRRLPTRGRRNRLNPLLKPRLLPLKLLPNLRQPKSLKQLRSQNLSNNLSRLRSNKMP